MASGNFEYYGLPPTPRGLEYRLEQVSTLNQDTFNTPYTVGILDVYVDGILQGNNTYTATDGVKVILKTSLAAGRLVKIISRSVALVGINGSYTQGQSDILFATNTALALKADKASTPGRGALLFYGDF